MFARGSKVYACTKREISMVFGSAMRRVSANLLPRFERITPAITARTALGQPSCFCNTLENHLRDDTANPLSPAARLNRCQ